MPRSMRVFLLVGMLCPTASALLMMTMFDALSFIDRQFVIFLLLTFPAGFAAAYVFGATGMGWGFGRWRFS